MNDITPKQLIIACIICTTLTLCFVLAKYSYTEHQEAAVIQDIGYKFSPAQSRAQDSTAPCKTVTINAKDPATGNVMVFTNTCDIPSGWEIQ